MNKKQKLVAKKHRKNKKRIKSLNQASIVIASKKSKKSKTESLSPHKVRGDNTPLGG